MIIYQESNIYQEQQKGQGSAADKGKAFTALSSKFKAKQELSSIFIFL